MGKFDYFKDALKNTNLSKFEDKDDTTINQLDTSAIKPLTSEEIASLSSFDLSSLYTFNVNSSGYMGNSIAGSGGGGGGGQFGVYGSGGNVGIGTGSTYAANSYLNGSTVNATWGNTVTGDVVIGGRSLINILEKLEDRLAILENPDPKKLEKHAALKKAYEHYKMLEKLIGED